MTDFEQLKAHFMKLLGLFNEFYRSDRYIFPRDIEMAESAIIRQHPRVYCGSTVNGHDPNGFTVANVSTGEYTITHNLGHTNYSLFLTNYNATNYTIFRMSEKSSTLVRFWVLTYSGTAVNTDFDYAVIINS